jgi:Gas vesicle synthesis protein GvpO
MRMIEIAEKARDAAALLTGLKVDVVSKVEHRDGNWVALVDMVEAKARAGENDLISTYEVVLDATGEVTGYQRVARAYRVQMGAASAA